MQIALLRRATIAQRIGRMRSLTQTVVFLSRRAIRRANPEASETDVSLRFVALHYGQDLADRVAADLRKRTS